MKSLATIVLVLCAVLMVGVSIADHQRLPDRMASHFDGKGVPDGWSDKAAFTRFRISLGLGIPAVVIGIIYSIRFLPSKFLIFPNPSYWRRPKNYRKACEFLFVSSLWFGSATIIWAHILFSTGGGSQPDFTAASGWRESVLGDRAVDGFHLGLDRGPDHQVFQNGQEMIRWSRSHC